MTFCLGKKSMALALLAILRLIQGKVIQLELLTILR